MSETKNELNRLADELHGRPYDDCGEAEQSEVDMELAHPGSLIPSRMPPG